MMDFLKLNNIIEKQIDRLDSMGLFDTGAKEEMDRGRTIARLAKTQVDSASLALEVEKFKLDYNKTDKELPYILSKGGLTCG